MKGLGCGVSGVGARVREGSAAERVWTIDA
jgi:hypothetical protein